MALVERNGRAKAPVPLAPFSLPFLGDKQFAVFLHQVPPPSECINRRVEGPAGVVGLRFDPGFNDPVNNLLCLDARVILDNSPDELVYSGASGERSPASLFEAAFAVDTHSRLCQLVEQVQLSLKGGNSFTQGLPLLVDFTEKDDRFHDSV